VGAELEVLVDGADGETGDPVGRTHREAPEIDGRVQLRGGAARPGQLARAKAVEALGIDVLADVIEVQG
jgi:hypothetical protein